MRIEIGIIGITWSFQHRLYIGYIRLIDLYFDAFG